MLKDSGARVYEGEGENNRVEIWNKITTMINRFERIDLNCKVMLLMMSHHQQWLYMELRNQIIKIGKDGGHPIKKHMKPQPGKDNFCIADKKKFHCGKNKCNTTR